ncbi:MAG: efflux transporter outer membrane subunit [Methylococcales bacterium]|nr:efflux transporter outer membrane subunit [Methylococcales bacterium]
MRHCATVSCALLLLCGCGDMPSRDAVAISPTFPAQWTSNYLIATNINPQWLNAFADATLIRLVNDALTHNYDLKAAAARVNAARQQAIIDGADRLPQLAVSPNYQRGNLQNTETTGSFNMLFDLSWEIDLWGRIRATQQATEQEASAVAADLQAAKLSLAARTAQSYFDLIEANLQVDVAEQSMKDRHTIADLIRGRFTRGLTGGLDLRLVLTDLANAEAQLASSRNQVQIITRRLEVLLGRYPSGELKQNAKLPAPPALIAAGLPSELLTRRPDIIAALNRVQAMDARVFSAKQALLPRIALTASGGTGSAALAELIDPRAAAWNLAMGLVQPIFKGGKLTGDIRKNEALTEEALNQYQSTALTAFREVEQALAAEKWLRAQEHALQEAVEQTEASRKLAVYSYGQGLIQILTLLDSYRSTYTAQSDHLTVQRQLINNRIDLYLALGGGV